MIEKTCNWCQKKIQIDNDFGTYPYFMCRQCTIDEYKIYCIKNEIPSNNYYNAKNFFYNLISNRQNIYSDHPMFKHIIDSITIDLFNYDETDLAKITSNKQIKRKSVKKSQTKRKSKKKLRRKSLTYKR
jgi:hypothetical protein